ncbi:sigma-70 family RNA polymerase sigma factor [Dyadobacter sp. CY261]|uniref:sigma-70 family RNA polymerase sigma factor n=1 Tax=Dyadobacter sp. CY261 TaxID=2907203 RepID=UPI001F458FFE|nr:sigma-70 family RNA polymerase sigma factor [Dyadobacter sp. CY261]MCF0071729.1 sigma-70 family RNA polymerase sigma factor [Dyadobacter sp. CY261]
MLDSMQSSDQELVGALRRGDEQAFTTIYNTYWYRMFVVAYRKLQHREVAEELIQDIFTRLWKEREKIVITRLDYYLFSAVRFEVIDYIRTFGPRNEYLAYYRSFAELQDQSTENTVAFNDLSETIDKGLEALPAKTREIFKLSRIENCPISKIAAEVQLSEKAVEYHITKATKAMRIYLHEALIFLIVLISSLIA